MRPQLPASGRVASRRPTATVAASCCAALLLAAVSVAAEEPGPTSRPAAPPAETASPAPAAPEVAAAADGEGAALARAVFEAHGGAAALAADGVLRFEFVARRGEELIVRRAHAWCPATNSVRVAYTSPGGPVEVFFPDFGRPEEGLAFRDGALLAHADAEAARTVARGAFINDGYWLLAPLKVLDPGVLVDAEPARAWQGRDVEVLRLSFGAVGLTPTDQYLLYLDPASRLLVGWRYIPAGSEGFDFAWEAPVEVGPFRLSPARSAVGGGRTITFENVAFTPWERLEAPSPRP